MITIRHTVSEVGQATELDGYYVLEGRPDVKVRVQVHLDRSYASQSWAKASVWTELGWREIGTYAYSEWASMKSRDGGTASAQTRIRKATTFLLQLATEVLA